MKKINWNNVGWRTLQGFIVAVLNTPLYVLIAGVAQDKRIEINGKLYDRVLPWFNQEWYQIGLICLFAILGVMISISFIKYVYDLYRADKRERLKNEIKGDKNARDIDKYL